jgi:hypothetical protein
MEEALQGGEELLELMEDALHGGEELASCWS